MTYSALFASIESQALENHLGLASGFGPFRLFLGRTETYQQLLAALKNDPTLVQVLVARIKSLLQTPLDSSKSHLHDTAIAVYIVALTEQQPRSLAWILTDDIAPDGLFWTLFAAQHLHDTLTSSRNHFSFPANSDSAIDMSQVTANTTVLMIIKSLNYSIPMSANNSLKVIINNPTNLNEVA
jgi:hypothetical protein